MLTTVKLHKRHFNAAATKARELGKTPERYIESLIDAATMSLDDVLSPMRAAFRKSGASEDELEAAVKEARSALRTKPSRKRSR